MLLTVNKQVWEQMTKEDFFPNDEAIFIVTVQRLNKLTDKVLSLFLSSILCDLYAQYAASSDLRKRVGFDAVHCSLVICSFFERKQMLPVVELETYKKVHSTFQSISIGGLSAIIQELTEKQQIPPHIFNLLEYVTSFYVLKNPINEALFIKKVALMCLYMIEAQIEKNICFN